MKNTRLLAVLGLILPVAAWAQDAAVPEMVEVEVLFFEVKAGQRPKLRPDFYFIPAARPDAPALLSVTGVFTAEQAGQWMKEMKAAGARLLDRQKTVVLSGHRARVQNVRELRYPSAFDTPKAPLAERLYPTAFETKNVGSQLELEPVIGPDGYTIDLIVSPRIVEFKGFVDATRISKDARPEHIQELLKNPPKKGAAWQPVFNSREVNTAVTIYNGQTVVLSSPATPDDPGMVILITARILPPQ